MRVIALVCLIALVVAGAAPAPAQTAQAPRLSAEARDRFAAALATYRAGDWGAAAGAFADLGLAATPLRDYALLFRAQSLYQLGDTTAARTLAARAADRTSDGGLVPSALLQAATILGNSGDEAGAAALLRRFLSRYADHAEASRARFTLAQALLAGGQPREAARVFREVWLTAPASLFADGAARQLQALAEGGVALPALTNGERLERAERLFGAGLAEPARAEADALLGEALATDLLFRALKLAEEAARKLGKYDAALAAVNRAVAAAPAERRAPWLLDLAKLQQGKSREQALLTLDLVVRDHPKTAEAAEALLLKARLLETAALGPAAEAVYVKLAAEYPDEDEAGAALWRLGWLAWFRGAWADAAALWGRLGVIRGGQHYRDAASYWAGRAHAARGDTEAAARQFSRLLNDAPGSYYGVLAARRGARAGAPRPVAAPPALPAEPLQLTQGETRYARAEWLRAVGLGDFADEEMEGLARRAAGDPVRLYVLSAAYAQDARYHLALRILRRHFQSVARSGLPSTPRSFWEMFYPLGWRAELIEAASHAATDPYLVAAVVREESSFHPQARSRAGARGLMQLMPDTARPMAQVRRMAFNDGGLLDEPAANLEMGSAFLGALVREFGDPRLAAAAYNAGPARVKEWWGARRSDDVEVWVEQIPFNETRAFVKRVMLSWNEYRRLYAGQP